MNVGNILVLTLFYFTLPEESNAYKQSNSGEDSFKRSGNHADKRFLVSQPMTGMCQVCTGPPIICETEYELQQCPLGKQYCINTVDNRADASRYVVRKCGTKDEYRTGWFEKYSSNDKCTAFDEEYIYANRFYCEFCCDTDGCNVNLNMDNKWHP